MPIDQRGTAHTHTASAQSAATPVSAPTPTNREKTREKISGEVANGISCSGCQARWSGAGRAHCSVCHRLFSTASKFDLHRTARGERGGCLDPATVTSRSGDRLLFFRDGMWRGPEMPADAVDARRSTRTHGGTP